MESPLCGAKTRNGGKCRKPAGAGTGHVGTGRCKLHGGASPQAELSGVTELARREATVMGQPLDLDPHEAILECIRIAAGEVQYASDRIAELNPDDAVGGITTVRERPLKFEKGAESETERVEETVRDHGAMHVWIVVRHQAMERLTKFSEVALRAGVEERLVTAAERYARDIAETMRALVEALGHDPTDPKIREAMRGSLQLVRGGLAS